MRLLATALFTATLLTAGVAHADRLSTLVEYNSEIYQDDADSD